MKKLFSLFRPREFFPVKQGKNPVSGVVAFDLGGVLLETNMAHAIWLIGPKTFFRYMLANRLWPAQASHQIKKKLYETLHLVKPLKEGQVVSRDETDTYNLPQVMCDLLQGTHTPEELNNQIEKTIQAHAHTFSSEAEKHAVQATARVVFVPANFANTRKICKATSAFARACKGRGHKIYIISNWDEHSFALIKKQHPKLFALFDGAIISGTHSVMKPDKKIFKLLLSDSGITNPKSCLLIDDLYGNITAAQEIGMNALHYTKQKHGWFSKKPNTKEVGAAFAAWEKSLSA